MDREEYLTVVILTLTEPHTALPSGRKGTSATSSENDLAGNWLSTNQSAGTYDTVFIWVSS